MRCIFCLKEREPSVEHVFPDAIGGTLIINRVCKACNDCLGSNVDVLLTDHVLVLAKRNQLAIASRGGKTPTWHDTFGLGSMATDPEQRVRIIEDANTGQIQPTLVHKEVRTKTDDGKETISVFIDVSQESEIGKIIQRTRKREGFPPLSDEELTQQVEAAKSQAGTIEHPQIVHKLKIDTKDFKRAICKIIYEMAWLWLGDSYLDEPIAARIRNYVSNGIEDSAIRGRIEIGSDVSPFNQLWKDEPNAHIAVSIPTREMISIGVRVFDTMCGTVVVTETPDRYPNFTTGQFFCCDPQSGKDRNTTIQDEIQRIMKR